MRGGRPRRARRAALLLVGLALAGAARGDPLLPELEPWPLWMRDAASVAGVKERRGVGPFFRSFEEEGGRRGWALAPLAAHVAMPEEKRFEYLYPLGLHARRPDGSSFRLTPLFDFEDSAQEEDGDDWTFLLAFGGRDEAADRYFGVFPLGGVARDRFGLERLEFWLFPLFARSEDRHGFKRAYFLWPFFSWGSGGGRRLLRIWPFYGHDVREGEHARRFALWPFLHWRRERLAGGAERRMRLFLPFYGEIATPHSRSRFFLGPLYLSAHNERTGLRDRSFLWPLVRFASTPAREGFAGSSEVRIEPFYRRRTAPGVVRTATLLGAVERSRVRRPQKRLDRWRWLWVSRFERAEDARSQRRLVRRDLWPLFRYQRLREVDEELGELAFPWILPVHGEGWQRHWLAPLTVYERRWTTDELRADGLFGIWRERRRGDQAVRSLGWLFRHEREAEATRLELLLLPIWDSD